MYLDWNGKLIAHLPHLFPKFIYIQVKVNWKRENIAYVSECVLWRQNVRNVGNYDFRESKSRKELCSFDTNLNNKIQQG
jgi:hypothetical protein